jgi:hypothetical protein
MEKKEKAFMPDSGFNECKKEWEISKDFVIKSITDEDTLIKVRKYAHQAYKEDPIEYQIRLKSTEIPDFYERAIQDTIDKVFDSSNTVKVVNIDPKIEIYLNDIDGRGNSIATIGKQIFNNFLIYGDGGGIVDFTTGSKSDYDNNKPYEGRPFFINMPSTSVIGVVTYQIEGVNQVIQLRFSTQEIEHDLEFNEVMVKRVREYTLLDNGKVQLTIYTKNDKEISSDSLIMKSVDKEILGIPICTASVNRGGITQPFRNKPPLSSLLRGCVELLRIQSHDNNVINVATTPMLIEEQFDGYAEQLLQLPSYDVNGNLTGNPYIDNSRSPNKVIVKKTGDKMYYVNTNDFKAGMEASEKRINKLVANLKSLGVNSLLEQTARETVVKTITNNSTSQSRLTAYAVEVENCLNDILIKFGEFVGVDKDNVGKVSIDMDFGSLDKNSLKSKESMDALRADKNESVIDKAFFLRERIARGSYATPVDDDDIESILGNAEAEAPMV